MHEGDLMNWLGDGWLGKLLLAALSICGGGVAGWLARKPIERAGILEAVNSRLEAYMGHLENEVKRLAASDKECKADLRAIHDRVEQLEGELRQEKQTAASIEKVRST